MPPAVLSEGIEMTTTRELLQLALKALEDCDKSDRACFSDVVLLNKIRAHLAEPEPEPKVRVNWNPHLKEQL